MDRFLRIEALVRVAQTQSFAEAARQLRFCASAHYLCRHGAPRLPRDLYGHRLALYSGDPTRDRFPEHRLSSFGLSVVYARTLLGAFKLRLFIESLGSSFGGGEPPWDKALIERDVTFADLLED
jgi:hypothetical protein